MQKVVAEEYTIKEVLNICLEKKLTFAAYRLPGEQETTLVVQEDGEILKLTDLADLPGKGGFVIAPFDFHSEKSVSVIRPDILIRNTPTLQQIQHLSELGSPKNSQNGFQKQDETKHEDFSSQIENTIREIKKGSYQKVVLSRIKTREGKFISRLSEIFNLMCSSYENAFVYLFQMNGHFWAGATPEPLICSRGDELVTVSLAGTRTFTEENRNIHNWNHKERVEQEYVTEYIENVFSQYQITDYIKTGPYTKKAGKLLHLRTDFTFSFETAGSKLSALIGALHPTSAVCGMPTDKAMNYISCVEKHDREFYSGFLGPVGLNDRLQLFVNLRCMKVLENQLTLYVGSGITSESKASEEWEETEIKADTLLSIVQQIK